MRRLEDRLRSYLVEDESVQRLTSGRLVDDAARGAAMIGLTDRRLLCVSERGELVDVRYDYVCSVRSRDRTRVRYRPDAGPNRTLRLGVGTIILGLLVAAVAATSPLTPVETVATVAVGAATAAVAIGLQSVRTRTRVGHSSDQLLVGIGFVSLLALVGVAVVAASVSLALYGLVTIGSGLVLGYAVRHRERLDGLGLEDHRESLLSVNTVDGETVHIAVEPDSTLARDLATCVYDRADDTVDVDRRVIVASGREQQT